MRLAALLLSLMLPASGLAQDAAIEDVTPEAPFKEGDLISFDELDKLKSYLPPEFWENRNYFFYEGMQITVGPAYRKYGAADAFEAATQKFKGQPKIGKDGALENYTAGQPFLNEEIDC